MDVKDMNEKLSVANVKEESKAMRVWLVELGTKAQKTKVNYLFYFEKFLDRFETTPDELYEIRLEDLRSKDPRDHRRIEGLVKTHMAEMQSAGAAAQTARMVQKAVKSFFESQNLDLKFKSKDRPKGASNGQRIVLHEHVAEMHDSAARALGFKKRNRALLMFGKDAGIRISDIANLDVMDYLDASDLVSEHGESFKEFLTTHTKKTRSLAHIMIGPEAVQHVDEYLEERKQAGTYGEDTPLFLMQDGSRFTSGALTQMFKRMAKKLGKDGKKRSAHSLRKFHQTMCESFMAKNWVNKLQGRVISDSTGVYSQPELLPGELSGAYMSGYDKLRVLGVGARALWEIGGETSALQEQVKELKTQLERASKDTEKVSDLEKRIDLMMPTFEAARELIKREREVSELKSESEEGEG